MEFSLVPLAERPELIDQCVDLLNEEWPRSQRSRLVGLERMLHFYPPMAYVLVETVSGNLVGHARLSPLSPGCNGGCWIESLVIRKGMRGRGIGRKMLAMVETEARKHGFDKICCSTTDKIDFYRHCGYQQSDRPIQNCGSNAPLLERFGLTALLTERGQNYEAGGVGDGIPSNSRAMNNQKGPALPSVPKPPVAPPLLIPQSHQNTQKAYIFKNLNKDI